MPETHHEQESGPADAPAANGSADTPPAAGGEIAPTDSLFPGCSPWPSLDLSADDVTEVRRIGGVIALYDHAPGRRNRGKGWEERYPEFRPWLSIRGLTPGQAMDAHRRHLARAAAEHPVAAPRAEGPPARAAVAGGTG